MGVRWSEDIVDIFCMGINCRIFVWWVLMASIRVEIDHTLASRRIVIVGMADTWVIAMPVSLGCDEYQLFWFKKNRPVVEEFVRHNLCDEVFEHLIEPFCSGK